MKEDVAKLRASPLINPNIEIYGFVYDVKVLAHAGARLPLPFVSMHGLSVLTLARGQDASLTEVMRSVRREE